MPPTDPIFCLIDNTEHDCREYLHNHLKKLGVSQEKYYLEYVKKYDLLTGEPIKFKSVDQYLNSDFNDKRNMKKWLLSQGKTAENWSIEWLKKRKESKSLVYSPTQVELLSLMAPSMHFYQRFGDYYKICREIGLVDKFSFIKLDAKKYRPITKIIQDTREKRPLNFKNVSIEVAKLDVGDYGLPDSDLYKVYVERKSISDFAQTVTRDRGRFEREIERAKQSNKHLVVLVESPLSTALSFDYLPQMKFSQVKPAHAFKNVRDILQKYSNVQFLFVNGRVEAANYLVKILSLGATAGQIDLQWYYENKLI
jgi:hypothetical protein